MENKENQENNIELKSVSELLGMKFFIPSYQRGYRWTKLEVEKLLDDINEFNKEVDGEFYCLQPLVVKHDKKRQMWRVIDAQQRLTTIYLILKVLKNDKVFSIEYERNTNIEECISNGKDVTIEEFYISKNKETIDQWVNKSCSEDSQKNSFKNKLLNHTKFIWYDIDCVPNADEYAMFRNLNSGKIPLTNAELVKALFLKNTKGDDTEKRIKPKYHCRGI